MKVDENWRNKNIKSYELAESKHKKDNNSPSRLFSGIFSTTS